MVRPVCFFLALALNHTPARSIILSKRIIKSNYRADRRTVPVSIAIKFKCAL